MQINRVIQERRRALGMTQEQVADALGVTPPAVNKWERGSTCPDLALLAPLARLLRIDLNELMGFHENLSDEEAQRFGLEVMQTAERDGLDAGFALARERLRAYPNSGFLAYTVAALLQSQIALSAEGAAKDEYEAQLDRWYELATNCDDARVRDRTAALLATRYISREDWDTAQRTIDAMPERQVMDRRAIQANLYHRQGKFEEAAKLSESMMLAAASEACSALQQMVTFELAAGEPEAAAHAADALERAVEAFDLWRYTSLAAPLECAIAARDVRESVRRLRQLLDALDEPWRPAASPLYRRISSDKEGTISGRAYALMCADLEGNSNYDFLRGDAEFQAILEEFRARAART